MAVVGFLHTSNVHVPTFRLLVGSRAPDFDVIDTVDETLLTDAQQRGIDDDIRERLRTRLVDLRGRGASVVVCTCSTLGAAAEQLSETVEVPVLRVDRAMAERAAAIGGRIAVVVAVGSSLASTRDLLTGCIAVSDREATVVDAPCLDAWRLFESGDIEGYIEHVARHVQQLAEQADVIVLAQASMAPAADRLDGLPVPVLCSPTTAVERAIAIAADQSRP